MVRLHSSLPLDLLVSFVLLTMAKSVVSLEARDFSRGDGSGFFRESSSDPSPP
jgi:hypothetical protein